MDDAILVAKAAAGDQDAFTLLVERYRRYIYAIAYRIALHEDDALDIAQNVLLRLVERIGQFDGRGPFRAWLAAVTAREAVSYRRRSQRRREDLMAPEEMAAMADGRTADGRTATGGSHAPAAVAEALDGVRRREMVEAAMADLSPQQRAIFALRFQEDMTPKEIAERIGLPAKQVRSQLCRAVARLKEMMAEKQ